MLFTSLAFAVFSVVFFSCWPLLRRRSAMRWFSLTLASFVFYGWWDWRYLSLILFTGSVDFAAGLAIQRWPTRRRVALVLSLTANLLLLGLFKYVDFALGALADLLRLAGITLPVGAVGLPLPVGISFYTFQSMSYTIDVYRGRIEPTRRFFHFFAYLSMFPHLVAGPIVRARDMLPQLEREVVPSSAQRWDGFRLIVHGYFKKMVVADSLAPLVDGAFRSSPATDGSSYWWLIMVMFAVQIYCDFSGYTDIARGLAKNMGLEIPENFRHPYTATSLRDFWQRWHISLSSWFRDYVYVPLGGGHRSVARGHLALWITMLLSGLWHGAAWTFVAWGAIHALLVSLERLSRWPERIARLPGGAALSRILVFAIVVLAWVPFRARDLAQAATILETMVRFDFRDAARLPDMEEGIALVAILLGREALAALGLDTWLSRSRLALAAEPVGLAILIASCVYLRGPGQGFIYFAF